MKAKRIPWNQEFLITEDKRVFNTKTNKYLKTSSVGAISIPYKKVQKMRYVNTLHKQAFDNSEVSSSLEPQTLEIWDQIPGCKDFALSTQDRLKNIRFDKIIKPNADNKLRFYNEKKILEMNAEDIRDYFFAEDSAPEQNAGNPTSTKEPAKAEDQWWDDFDADGNVIIHDSPKKDDELIIDDFDDEGNEINHDSPAKPAKNSDLQCDAIEVKPGEPIPYGVIVKTESSYRVRTDPRDIPPEYRELTYKGELIDPPKIDECTDEELREREIAQNQYLEELWTQNKKDRRGY